MPSRCASASSNRQGTPDSLTAPERIAVLGAGSWGTALAIHLARAGNPTRLWGRDAQRMATMAKVRQNLDYLPGFQFPDGLEVCADFAACLDDIGKLLIVVPSHAFRDTLSAAAAFLKPDVRLAWASKGFENGTGRLLHQVARDILGEDCPGAILTGPSFAQEVADNLPTAITVASPDKALAAAWVEAVHHGSFRAYRSDDIIGAELGGAVKNVMAVGTGIADGMGLGTNARAALITRGLAEMMRLSAALGARPETLMGLSGIGDLVLTCTGDLSRNRRYGLALGQGRSHQQALDEIGQVVEGVRTAEELMRLAQRHQVELPISEQIHRIIQGDIGPRDGVSNLLAREPKAENE